MAAVVSEATRPIIEGYRRGSTNATEHGEISNLASLIAADTAGPVPVSVVAPLEATHAPFEDVTNNPLQELDESRLNPRDTIAERLGRVDKVTKKIGNVFARLPEFNWGSVFKNVYLNNDHLLELNNDYNKIPGEDSYAIFSHIYRFLTENNANVTNKSRFLLKIKTDSELFYFIPIYIKPLITMINKSLSLYFWGRRFWLPPNIFFKVFLFILLTFSLILSVKFLYPNTLHTSFPLNHISSPTLITFISLFSYFSIFSIFTLLANPDQGETVLPGLNVCSEE